MGRRKLGRGFGSGLTSGIMAGLSIGKVLRENMDRSDLADAMNSAATEQKTVLTEQNAPSQETHTYDSDTGQYVPSLNAIQSGVSDTLQPQQPEFSSSTQKVDRQFSSPQEKRTAMLQAGIDHLISRGDPERANDLRSKTLVPSSEIIASALASGISERSIQRAAEQLGVTREKSGFSGGWIWAMPNTEGATV